MAPEGSSRINHEAASATDGIDAVVEVFSRAMLDFAQDATGPLSRGLCYCLGGLTVTLETNSPLYEERLTRALRHAALPPEREEEAAVKVFAVDAGAQNGLRPPGWPFPYADRRHLERLHVTAERDVYVTFNEDTRTWHVFDRGSRRAAIWTQDASCLPDWEHAFPLRTNLNWLYAPSPLTLAHAAAVGDGACGVLLAGAGGAGKSTTTAACLDIGFKTCGDDFVAITCDEMPRAYSLFDTVKLDERSLAWFPHLEARVANPGTAHQTKARIHLFEAGPSLLMPSCEVRALVVPRLTEGNGTRIQPVSKAVALRALAPTTLFLVRGTEAETAAKLAALVRRLPTYELLIGGRPAEAAAAIRSLLDEGAP
jgi:hypothetical protein